MKTINMPVVVAAICALPWASPAAGETHFKTIYTFADDNPVGLTYANGVFYGATSGGLVNCGTVFELQPPTASGSDWTETTLYSFPPGGTGACQPVAAPLTGPGGVLYGGANGGADGSGTVYELQPPASPGAPWTETVIYNFGNLGTEDSGGPTSIQHGPNGSLYIATSDGGSEGDGELVALDPPAAPGAQWTATTLYSFGPNDVTQCISPNSLTSGPNGVLYGTTNRGGPDNAGTVFDLFPPATEGGVWAASVLYIFEGLPGGAAPYNMILGPDGSLYGATEGRIPDGNYGAGTVFQLTPPASPGGSWTETTLHTLEYDTFNCGPDSPLILHVGNLYGASCLKGGGVVFELQPPTEPGGAWTEVPLHTFTNGQIPAGAMVMTESGTIYGATALPYGETPGGTIFEITMQ